MRARPRPSLTARAISLLAQREHSRSELRTKLLRLLQADRAAARRLAAKSDSPSDASSDTSSDPAAEPDPQADRHQVDTLLDELETQGHLSDARFTASRVRVRAARFGAERIRQELSRHGIALPTEERQELQRSELDRAREVWRRKFGSPAPDAAGRARQSRFLASRGFAGDVIRRIVLGPQDD